MTRAFIWHHNGDLVTVMTVLLNTLLKNVNFRHNLHEQRRGGMAFIFQININCGKTFHPVICFSSWLLPCYWWLPFIYGCHISDNSYSNCFTWFHWLFIVGLYLDVACALDWICYFCMFCVTKFMKFARSMPEMKWNVLDRQHYRMAETSTECLVLLFFTGCQPEATNPVPR